MPIKIHSNSKKILNTALFITVFLSFNKTFYSWAHNATALPLCSKILSGSESNSSVDVEKIRAHIAESGFNKIEGSDKFISGNIIAESVSDGNIHLYFEKVYHIEPYHSVKENKPNDALSAADAVLAVLLRNNQLHIIDRLNAIYPLNKQALQNPQTQKPLLEQIVDAGFKQVPGTKNIYKYSSEKSGQNMIAIMDGQKLVRLFLEIDKFKSDKLPQHYSIVGVTSEVFDNGKVRENYSNLKITDGAKILTITSLGEFDKGSIIFEEIIEPVFFRQRKGTLHFPEPTLEKDSKFIIGGKNKTETIERLKTINGNPISELESVLRPGESSDAGFLGESESLLKVLAEDNNFVVKEMGLTHQILADHLKTILDIWRQAGRTEVVFTYEGRKYRVNGSSWRGFQQSPFGDNTLANEDITIANLENHTSISFSGLLPEMIWRYGFYEGKKTPYRLEPKSIVRVLDFLIF